MHLALPVVSFLLQIFDKCLGSTGLCLVPFTVLYGAILATMAQTVDLQDEIFLCDK